MEMTAWAASVQAVPATRFKKQPPSYSPCNSKMCRNDDAITPMNLSQGMHNPQQGKSIGRSAFCTKVYSQVRAVSMRFAELLQLMTSAKQHRCTALKKGKKASRPWVTLYTAVAVPKQYTSTFSPNLSNTQAPALTAMNSCKHMLADTAKLQIQPSRLTVGQPRMLTRRQPALPWQCLAASRAAVHVAHFSNWSEKTCWTQPGSMAAELQQGRKPMPPPGLLCTASCELCSGSVAVQWMPLIA